MQCPIAARLHCLGNQLKLATTLIDRQTPADQHRKTVGWAEPQKVEVPSEKYDRELSFTVLEGEVAVP
jgi:hypothetical protein